VPAKVRGLSEKPEGSGIWWVQWFDAEGRRHREKAGTKAAAIKLKAKRTTDRLEARKIPETLKHKRDVRFGELMEDALQQKIHEYGKSAISNFRGMVKALTPEFGERSASTITTEQFVQWLRKRSKSQEWADGTYNTYVTQLKVMYRLGIEQRKVDANPAANLKRRTLHNDRPRYLTDDEEERLEKAFEQWPQHREAYLFAKHTGLRAGAQFHLKWSQVDMPNRSLALPQIRNSKYRKHRVLPLNSVAFQVLKDRKARKNPSPLVFSEYHAREYLTKPAHWFPKIVREAGIEDFTWHSLRHDFASQLVMRNTDLKTVQSLMGHANIKQTAMYADLSPEHLRSAVDNLTAKRPTVSVGS
jgi:site-specific recombinase XerD